MSQRSFEEVQKSLRMVIPVGPANSEVFGKVVAAIAADDFQQAAQHMTVDVELRIQGFAELDGHWIGREAVTSAMAVNFDKVSAQIPEVESMVQDSRTLALMLHETGRLTATGAPYRVRGVIWCAFEGGLISRIEEFLHRLA